jgi:hypothetical protein
MINALIYTFALGYEMADRYRESSVYPDFVVTSNNGTLNAKLVRAGDRGVLFFEESTKDLLFLPWNEIKKVDSTRGRKK